MTSRKFSQLGNDQHVDTTHAPFESRVCLEQSVHRVVVLTRVHAVDKVVGAHERQYARLNRTFTWWEVNG